MSTMPLRYLACKSLPMLVRPSKASSTTCVTGIFLRKFSAKAFSLSPPSTAALNAVL